ncbi:hypothetical protein EX895_004462 [Sporisorium graminicola]|uniref:Uncharacterized protein n=1 Tax=Sporisorium graminicola TaxID=280036 RepID=A0A4U7KQX2_9BASI|nr:hypothetical protein EX895_004462 [Sporisorium graminicola]TKY86821.1 hypothetical protein EX895_004462 [Sporisorium graminicola]
MNALKANQEVQQVVQDLLSRDPVRFNSTINAHFASSSTYQGRGLKITGASQLKHAAYLLNVLDFGSATKISDQDIRWDAASSTAIVKAVRYVRPAFFPLFQFAIPTKVVLSFNAEEGAKDTLYCTQWRDEWPLEQLIQAVPLVRTLYSSLVVPVLTMVFLWASNIAFWLHSRVESLEHRYARDAGQVYLHKVEPRLPPSLTKGFDHGVHAAEHVGQQSVRVLSRVSHKPLKVVEELARTTTVVFNLALPQQLQLPYPSVFAEDGQAGQDKSYKAENESHASVNNKLEKDSTAEYTSSKSPRSAKAEVEGSRSPKSKVSGSPSVDKNGSQTSGQTSTDQTQTDQPASDDAAAEDHKRKAESAPSEEPRHAKVVIGPSADSTQQPQAKEIDLVTHQVTEKAPTESAQESLYQLLKKDDQLPGGHGSGSGGKKASGKKKGKSGGRK